SGVISLDVEYGPKNTSVSVRPSTEKDTGSNITLICSSHANPPVENYTWFKICGGDIVDVGHQPVFFPGESGQYLCSVSNKHGSQNSSAVQIPSHWATFTRDVLVIATVATVAMVAMLLTVTTVIVVKRLNNKTTWFPKTDCEENTQVAQYTDYVNWFICDHNQAQVESQCEGGTTELVYASVHFHNKRKSNNVTLLDLKTLVTKTNGNGAMKEGDSVNLTCKESCDGGDLSSAFTWFKDGKAINGPKNTSGSARPSTEVEASSNITLTCSSYANPPVENYTWFKIVDRDTGVVSVGNKFELHFRVVSPAVDGQYFCSATNKHGSQNSSIVTLKVKAFSPNSVFTRNVVINATAATVTALLIVTIIIAVRK
ncbi:B-cell receptor CD22-like, partial [Seriola lalandi dorsalis]|uniref:B-cell receptor CD22-like n=1 Tax=Seriola lalandi dorsalis TaxID=1841481 RepID=UPI000C6F7AA9